MGVKIDAEVPEWLVNAAAKVLDNPEAGLYVAFTAQSDVFYPALRVSAVGLEYSIPGGMTCAQPIADVVAYRIGPDGEAVGVRGVTVEFVSETVVEAEPAVKVAQPAAKPAEPAIYDAQGGELTIALANWAQDVAAHDPRSSGAVQIIAHPDTIEPFKAMLKREGLHTPLADRPEEERSDVPDSAWIEDRNADRGTLWALSQAALYDSTRATESLTELALAMVINLACDEPKAATV